MTRAEIEAIAEVDDPGSENWTEVRLARIALAAIDVVGAGDHATAFLGWNQSEEEAVMEYRSARSRLDALMEEPKE